MSATAERDDGQPRNLDRAFLRKLLEQVLLSTADFDAFCLDSVSYTHLDVYKRQPLELRAHGSALVPFVQEALEVETITFLSAPGDSARSGLRLQNSTRQTLPGGTLAVLGDGGLLGESALERLKPGERRFLQYGVELDVEATRVKQTQKEEPQRLTFEHDTLEEHFLRRRDQLLRVENRSGQSRQLYLGMGLAANSQVQGADRLDFCLLYTSRCV